MMITPEAFWLLLWLLSCLLCAPIAIFAAMGRRFGPFTGLAAANALAGLVWLGFTQARAAYHDFNEARFIAADPGHPDAAFAGRSLHIDNLQNVLMAAYRCRPGGPPDCALPVAVWLASGQIEYIEIGTNPIIRYEMVVHDAGCLDPARTVPVELGEALISAPLGACIIGTEVPEARADHRIVTERKIMPRSDRRPYIQADLTQTETGTLLARFDGWLPGYDAPTGAMDQERFNRLLLEGEPAPPPAPRGAGPLISAFLMQPPSPPSAYDPSGDLALMEHYGLDPLVLIAAAGAQRQNARARAVWFACNGQVLPRLSADTVTALAAAGGTVFPNSPGWRFPTDCPDRVR